MQQQQEQAAAQQVEDFFCKNDIKIMQIDTKIRFRSFKMQFFVQTLILILKQAAARADQMNAATGQMLANPMVEFSSQSNDFSSKSHKKSQNLDKFMIFWKNLRLKRSPTAQ